MTKTEMLTKLRILLSDAQEVGYPEDSELLDYLSSATANLLRGETEAAVNKLQEAVYFSNMNKRGIIPDPVMWGG